MNGNVYKVLDRALDDMTARLNHTSAGCLLDEARTALDLRGALTTAVDNYVGAVASLLGNIHDHADGREDAAWPELRDLVLDYSDELRRTFEAGGRT
jgi:hypothetical protein